MPEGTITALRTQEGDSQRVNVFINEVFALGVSHATLVREDLYVGKYLDAAQWARLETTEHTDKCYQAALRYLQARPRSTEEVRKRLQQKQFAPQAIEDTIGRLTDQGLLDDEAFARFWVENRNACRPRGPRALRAELAQKGIDRTLIDTTLHDDDLMGDEHEQALTLARAALPRYTGAADRAAFQRRLGGYLQRRGFGYDTIKPILDTLWREVQHQYE